MGTPWDTIYDHFCVLCQPPNPQYWIFWSKWRLQIPGGISSFFSSNFPSNAVRIMSGDPFVDPSYDHIHKSIHSSFLPSSLPPKMYVFMNMVITQVKNGSPDMIPTAFEGKFNEKKMRYLPGFVDLICFKIFNIGDLGGWHKTQKWS